MIFASDLDRTLIYSDKFIREFQGQVRAVESGQHFSYMTVPALSLLKQITYKSTFVPCTTRTIEQYQRIHLFQNEVMPKYAVVSNGANILVDGVIDIGYKENICRKLTSNCMAWEDMLAEFNKLKWDLWAKPMRNADGVFYYCIIDRDKAPLQELTVYGEWANKQNWDISIQGRKLYLVPQFINKWPAIERIAEITGEKGVIGAGDSLLDQSLIQGADYAISPGHGELYEQFSKSGDWLFTKSSGITAGEEILEKVIIWVDYNQ